MKKNILFYVAICSWSISIGQIQVLNLPTNPFQKKKEISGIAVGGDTLFLASEKCKKVYLVNKTTLGNIGSIDLTRFLPSEVEIEGIALADNFLYITDEKNCKIWVYDLSQSNMTFINPLPPISLTGFLGHMEGIAINGNLLYLLKDNNGHSQSEIHVFKINFQARQMNSVCKVLIDNANSLRYSDIFFDNHSGRLIGIKSSLQEYYIDELDIATVNTDTSINSNSFRHLFSLTDTVRNNSSRYATNLEGLTIDSNFMYVVSDNIQTGSPKCQQSGDLPLFLKIAMTR